MALTFFSKFDTAYLTFPFNLCITMMFFVIRGTPLPHKMDQEEIPSDDLEDDIIDWSKVSGSTGFSLDRR